MDTKQVKQIADKEVKAHEKRMHPGAKKMRAGGKTNADRKSTRLNSSHVSESRMPSSA